MSPWERFKRWLREHEVASAREDAREAFETYRDKAERLADLERRPWSHHGVGNPDDHT